MSDPRGPDEPGIDGSGGPSPGRHGDEAEGRAPAAPAMPGRVARTWSWITYRARGDFRRHPGTARVIVAAFFVATLILGAVAVGRRTADDLAPGLRGGVHLVVYLGADAGPTRAKALATTIGEVPGVRRVGIVSGEEARARLAARLGPANDLLTGIEEGFLPTSLDVELLAEVGVDGRAHELAERLRPLPGIAAVDELVGEVDRVAAWMEAASALSVWWIVLGVTAAAACLALAVAVGRRQRQREAQLWVLLGATPWIARGPAALAGGLAATVGAGLALPALWLIVRWGVSGPLDTVVGFVLRAQGGMPFLSPADMAKALLLAALTGALVGVASARPPRTA